MFIAKINLKWIVPILAMNLLVGYCLFRFNLPVVSECTCIFAAIVEIKYPKLATPIYYFAIKLAPKNFSSANSYWRLLNCYAKTNNPEAAIGVMKEFKLLRVRKFSHIELSHFEKLRELNDSILLHPSDPENYLQRGRLIRYMNCDDIAERDFAKAFSLYPDTALRYLKMAFSTHEPVSLSGYGYGYKSEKEIASMNKAITLTRSNKIDLYLLRAYWYKFRLLVRDAKSKKAMNSYVRDLETVLSLAEQQPDGLRELYKAQAFRMLQKHDRCRELLDLAQNKGFAEGDLEENIFNNTGIRVKLKYESSSSS